MNKVIQSQHFTAERAWGALDITNMNGISVRLHWTDKPYKWHINDGEEVFAVMDGTVEMRYKEEGQEKAVLPHTGDIFLCGYRYRTCSSSTRRSAHISHRERRQYLIN